MNQSSYGRPLLRKMRLHGSRLVRWQHQGRGPLANQAQKDIFEGVCNSHNDNGCSGEFNPKCAAAGAAGLRAGVVTMLVVAAFALLVGH